MLQTAISLPFSLLHRSVRSAGERDQAAKRASFDATKWTLELLRHLEWRRFEELCTAYFEALGFTASVTRSRADGAAARLGEAERALRDAEVTAPFDGMVAQRWVSVGAP